MVERPARDAEARALVERARMGDARAFGRLVEMYMRAVYAIAHRMMGNHDDADDVAQETFIRAHGALDRYDPSYSFYTWLRTIATRVALHELAKRKRRRTEGGETFEVVASTVAAATAGPEDLAAAGELQQSVARAVEMLPEEFRAVVVLRVYEDLSYAEIARILEVPIGTVMSRLARARDRLRAALGHDPRVTETEAEGKS